MKAPKEISNEVSKKKHNVNMPMFSAVSASYCVLFLVILFLGCTVNGKEQGLVTYLRGQKGDNQVDKNAVPATLLSGGGRDWTLNLQEGTISPKHDDKFVLGAHPNTPLVLTIKGESNQITFSTDDLKTLKDGESVSMDGIGLQYPDSKLKELDGWYYTEACAVENKSIEVQYLDNNFLAMKDEDGHDLVLDVSFWMMESGNTVNFVRAGESEWSWLKPKTWFQKTFLYGGGRDWILNVDDGTISPKHKPYLVLGQGPIRLILAEKNSPSTIKFDNLDDLAKGKSTTLTYSNKQKALGKMKKEEQYAGPWRYIESKIVEPTNAAYFKYIENNFIGTVDEGKDSEKSLVLDVSYWKMINGMPVNFVGGWTWKQSEKKTTDGDNNFSSDS